MRSDQRSEDTQTDRQTYRTKPIHLAPPLKSGKTGDFSAGPSLEENHSAVEQYDLWVIGEAQCSLPISITVNYLQLWPVPARLGSSRPWFRVSTDETLS